MIDEDVGMRRARKEGWMRFESGAAKRIPKKFWSRGEDCVEVGIGTRYNSCKSRVGGQGVDCPFRFGPLLIAQFKDSSS